MSCMRLLEPEEDTELLLGPLLCEMLSVATYIIRKRGSS